MFATENATRCRVEWHTSPHPIGSALNKVFSLEEKGDHVVVDEEYLPSIGWKNQLSSLS